MIPGDFQIEVFSLPFGKHSFHFKTDASFFNRFNPESGFDNARLDVDINIYKKNLVQEAEIQIEAALPVSCNRCNAVMMYPVQSRNRVVIKKGNPSDSTEEIIYGSMDEEFVDFSQYVYDTVLTSIPPRLIPCEENHSFTCNTELLEKLKNLESEPLDENPSDSSVSTLGELHSDVFKQLSNLHKN